MHIQCLAHKNSITVIMMIMMMVMKMIKQSLPKRISSDEENETYRSLFGRAEKYITSLH